MGGYTKAVDIKGAQHKGAYQHAGNKVCGNRGKLYPFCQPGQQQAAQKGNRETKQYACGGGHENTPSFKLKLIYRNNMKGSGYGVHTPAVCFGTLQERTVDLIFYSQGIITLQNRNFHGKT